MSKIISPRYVLDKTHGKFLKPEPQQPISAQTGWGVTDPSEKQWIERHIRGETGIVSAERTAALEKQIQTLMFVRKEVIQLRERNGKLKKRNQELNNKLIASELRAQRLEQERNQYYEQTKQLRRFNNLRKESGLPTLPPANSSE